MFSPRPNNWLPLLCRRSWSHFDHEKQIMKEIQFKYSLFIFRLNLSMAINCRKFRLYYPQELLDISTLISFSSSRIFVQIVDGKNLIKLEAWLMRQRISTVRIFTKRFHFETTTFGDGKSIFVLTIAGLSISTLQLGLLINDDWLWRRVAPVVTKYHKLTHILQNTLVDIILLLLQMIFVTRKFPKMKFCVDVDKNCGDSHPWGEIGIVYVNFIPFRLRSTHRLKSFCARKKINSYDGSLTMKRYRIVSEVEFSLTNFKNI